MPMSGFTLINSHPYWYICLHPLGVRTFIPMLLSEVEIPVIDQLTLKFLNERELCLKCRGLGTREQLFGQGFSHISPISAHLKGALPGQILPSTCWLVPNRTSDQYLTTSVIYEHLSSIEVLGEHWKMIGHKVTTGSIWEAHPCQYQYSLPCFSNNNTCMYQFFDATTVVLTTPNNDHPTMTTQQ